MEAAENRTCDDVIIPFFSLRELSKICFNEWNFSDHSDV